LAAAHARAEYDRFGALLAGLSPAEWALPTVCPSWDVRLLAAHVLGATEANASPPELLRQLRHGRRGLAVDVDPVSAVQVDRRRHLTPDALLARYRAAVPAAVSWRFHWVRRLGALPIRVGVPVHETWRLGYLMRTIYTRDVWLHRDDLSRATGRAVALTAEHDGRIVADVVADWARRHGRPFRLVLHGPAGGEFGSGTAGPQFALDAVEFCRVLSGRGIGTAPFATRAPF
jgi:uncharacterized protein (TIGR03083 family)